MISMCISSEYRRFFSLQATTGRNIGTVVIVRTLVLIIAEHLQVIIDNLA